MRTAPIVEIARAYGLHPRLWLLVSFRFVSKRFKEKENLQRCGHVFFDTAVSRKGGSWFLITALGDLVT